LNRQSQDIDHAAWGFLLRRLDRVDKHRSALQEPDRNDIEIIDRHAARLNREAMDTLEYQRLP
jgi:hypothetical protein